MRLLRHFSIPLTRPDDIFVWFSFRVSLQLSLFMAFIPAFLLLIHFADGSTDQNDWSDFADWISAGMVLRYFNMVKR